MNKWNVSKKQQKPKTKYRKEKQKDAPLAPSLPLSHCVSWLYFWLFVHGLRIISIQIHFIERGEREGMYVWVYCLMLILFCLCFFFYTCHWCCLVCLYIHAYACVCVFAFILYVLSIATLNPILNPNIMNNIGLHKCGTYIGVRCTVLYWVQVCAMSHKNFFSLLCFFWLLACMWNRVNVLYPIQSDGQNCLVVENKQL